MKKSKLILFSTVFLVVVFVGSVALARPYLYKTWLDAHEHLAELFLGYRVANAPGEVYLTNDTTQFEVYARYAQDSETKPTMLLTSVPMTIAISYIPGTDSTSVEYTCTSWAGDNLPDAANMQVTKGQLKKLASACNPLKAWQLYYGY